MMKSIGVTFLTTTCVWHKKLSNVIIKLLIFKHISKIYKLVTNLNIWQRHARNGVEQKGWWCVKIPKLTGKLLLIAMVHKYIWWFLQSKHLFLFFGCFYSNFFAFDERRKSDKEKIKKFLNYQKVKALVVQTILGFF